MGPPNVPQTNEGSTNEPHDDPVALEATKRATDDHDSQSDVGGNYGGLRRVNSPQGGEDHGEPLGNAKRAHSIEGHRYRQQTGEVRIGGMAQQQIADHDAVRKAGEVGKSDSRESRPTSPTGE